MQRPRRVLRPWRPTHLPQVTMMSELWLPVLAKKTDEEDSFAWLLFLTVILLTEWTSTDDDLTRSSLCCSSLRVSKNNRKTLQRLGVFRSFFF